MDISGGGGSALCELWERVSIFNTAKCWSQNWLQRCCGSSIQGSLLNQLQDTLLNGNTITHALFILREVLKSLPGHDKISLQGKEIKQQCVLMPPVTLTLKTHRATL